MPDQSQMEQLAMLKRLELLVAALPDDAPGSPPAPRTRSSKPIALTLRLDPARYERLNAYAGRFTPRKSFQRLILEAIDGYLDE